MQNIKLILAALVVFIAGFSWWLSDDELADEPETAFTTSGTRDIDYRIKGFDVVRMTPEGKPAHRLMAESLKHFTDDDTTELESPFLTVFQDDTPPWDIRAEQAWMSADGSLVLLSGDVVIDRAGTATESPTRIHTRDLRVQPRQDYAETDERVRVETDTDWLDAAGMQAWLRPPSRLKFLSEVEAFYVPR